MGDLVERKLSELSGFWEEKVSIEAVFLVAKVDTVIISEDIVVDTVVYLMDMVDTEVAMGCTDLDMEDTEVVIVTMD